MQDVLKCTFNASNALWGVFQKKARSADILHNTSCRFMLLPVIGSHLHTLAVYALEV